jgi:F0F1-type ATP synthase assembly protein I
MFKTKFMRNNFILIISILIVIIALYSLSVISLRVFYSIILPALFISISFHIAIYFQFKAEKKQNEEFIGAIFAGMGIRLFLLVVFTITSIKFLDINKNSFIFSILIFYIYYLTMEIIYICIRNK